jgi:hypothetical protein
MSNLLEDFPRNTASLDYENDFNIKQKQNKQKTQYVLDTTILK